MSKRKSTPSPYLEDDTRPPQEAIGESEAFLDFQGRLSRVAKIERPVLIIGERGTGKELAAARLHYLSSRWEGPMVTLNCATLAESLLESELFGHEAGSFTGAAKRRHGRFEAANHGTLFLDEIGQIPMSVQEKILRVVEYSHFERVGSSESIDVDVRIIGATNADLPKMSKEGKFKEDLLDRLSFEVLFLPPLRERQEDIMILARHFATRMAMEIGTGQAPDFSERAIQALEKYRWPGNIRELKNVVERAVYACEDGVIKRIEFDPFKNPYEALGDEFPGSETSSNGSGELDFAYQIGQKPFRDAVNDMEQVCLRKALERNQFNQKKAAEELGMNYNQFRGLYRKHASDLGLD